MPFSVLQPRITIIDDLKKAWNITKETHNVLVKKLQTDPLIQQLMYLLTPSFSYVIFSPFVFNFLSNPLFLREISLASDEKGKQDVDAVKGNQLKPRTIVNKEDLLSYVGFLASSLSKS